jgi:hypothetical protein
MSSLVDYGSSDESENASDEDSKRVVECEPPAVKKIGDSEDNQSVRQDENLNLGLFSSLPPPKEAKPGFALDTDDDRFIISNFKHMQKKQPVKITIPSLSEVMETSVTAEVLVGEVEQY